MKIEMGESIVYSWLRHEKGCQIAQTNWKASNYWEIGRRDELEELSDRFRQFYEDKYRFDITKGSSIDQFLKQAEIDVLGISSSSGSQRIYAVDVAFHEGGLSYGDKSRTLNKIVQKCVRSVLCLYGYFGAIPGEVMFVSPKINPAVETELSPLFDELNRLLQQFSLPYSAKLYCNGEFGSQVMQPLLAKSKNIADTGELFMRSIQMYQMFGGSHDSIANKQSPAAHPPIYGKTETTEGKAVRKIPKWAAEPSQNNYKIIRAYLQLLEEHGYVTRPVLESRCQSPQKHPDVYVSDFRGNFRSMKTDSGKSHGKVFTDDGYNIGIWDPVAETIEQYRSFFLK